MGRRTKQENPVNTKTRILDEAAKLFADKGFDATGIDEISKKVGITKSVIYYHFRNKDEILQTIFDDYYEIAMKIKSEVGKTYIENGGGDILVYLEHAKKYFNESYTRVLKIALMESLKKSDKFPLLELIQRIFDDAMHVFKDKIKEDVREERQKIFAGFFFMMSFPFIGYLVLGDKYCKSTGDSKGDLEKSVFNEFEQYLEPALKRLIFDL